MALIPLLYAGCGSGAAESAGPGAETTRSSSAAPTRAAFRLMPLGDSLTEGANGGYRPQLYELLRARGYRPDFVGSKRDPFNSPDRDHEGHPGASIGAIRENLDGWLASAKPDVVIVMLGTNNVAWWSAQSGEEHANELSALIDAIYRQLPNVSLVVASIPPLSSKRIEPNGVDRVELAKAYNRSVAANVERLRAAGKRIRFADVNAVLSTSDMDDGVHPRSQAHYKPVAELFAKQVEALLEKPSAEARR